MNLEERVDWQAYCNRLGIEDLQDLTRVQNGRNEVVRARLANGRELLFKHGRQRLANRDGSLLSEGLAYHAFSQLGLSALLPRCILHDRKRNLLVLEWVGDTSARESWAGQEVDSIKWASLGVALARLHGATDAPPEWAERLLGDFTELIPSADPVVPDDLVDYPSAHLQIIAIIQADSAVIQNLKRLRTPTDVCLIHGDARLDNIIVSGQEHPKFIDLELARVGDPHFDLGTLLGSIVEHATHQFPLGDDTRASEYARVLLERTATELRSVIAGYRAEARGASDRAVGDEAYLSRVAAFVGVHLLHRSGALAEEYCAETRLGRVLAIMGCSFLKNPSYFLRPLSLDASHAWVQEGRGLR
ncbi:aminoglycoside phosphotransferase (APT) family kinase protein [Leucobacter luti]|uniref:aminoglycoside phosphotransferase family protein n=1 Tax=Leucobacter luti TaxID=340320 RepID=UPI001043A630|nr:aminoglycoside phosphotransferase family protein [Leucobacter luti]MCW2287122.1 aminoglycoside phosphotransferase [Leucobacter luti]TCK41347.1 aminoglycoside phosphotransferase (APT) family kinase protein [Leucobacter luti]